MSIVSLFCEIHDFFMMYETHLSTHCLPDTPPETRGRPRRLHPSEVMTILIAFHQSNYRTFKHFYEKHICVYYLAEFPHLVSYSRFVQLKKEVLKLLTFYLFSERGKTSMGWFYGFKLHLIINDTGDILDVALTPGTIDVWGLNPETPLQSRNSTSKGLTWFTKSEPKSGRWLNR